MNEVLLDLHLPGVLELDQVPRVMISSDSVPVPYNEVPIPVPIL
jgi:hypothetical protein